MDTPKFARIYLAKGLYALVDYRDAERCALVDWRPHMSRRTMYAKTSSTQIGSNQRLMHRFILGLKPGEKADHWNGNGLDNRRENLRDATSSQNAQNSYIQRGPKTSRFKGVYWDKRRESWAVQITLEGKTQSLGYFDDEVAAAKAYDEAALLLFGEFARTNLMMALFLDQAPTIRNQPAEHDAPVVATPFQQKTPDAEFWARGSRRYHRFRSVRRGHFKHAAQAQKNLG